MATVAPPEDKKELLPPDEKFWQRYSPHYEMPLAGMASVLAHALIFGILFVSGLIALMNWRGEASRPPNMDVIQIEGGGIGLDDPGGGGFGDGKEAGPMSDGQPILETKENSSEPLPQNAATLTELPKVELEVPDLSTDPTQTDSANVMETLMNVGKEADVQAKKEVIAPKMPGPSTGGTKKGEGGLGKGQGKGVGSGIGPGSGLGRPGTGKGTGPGGKPATRQQILANRWRFDLSGDAHQHAEKLAEIGVTVGLLDPRSNFLVVQDVKQRPVRLRTENLAKYKDAVTWFNRQPQSLQGLQRELGLPFMPQAVVLLLPKDREEVIAAEEARFAQQQGRSPEMVNATWFDFRLRDGAYAPIALRQE